MTSSVREGWIGQPNQEAQGEVVDDYRHLPTIIGRLR
jgi:hypothetical protein